MPTERRQYRRIPIGAAVRFQELSFLRNPEPIQAVYRDVSVGGLLLRSEREHPLGTLLKLEVKVPGWAGQEGAFSTLQAMGPRPLVAVGEVVRLERLEEGACELGIKFLNVHPDDWQALQAFLASAAPADDPS